MAYVVRDRRALGLLFLGGGLSAVVVVLLCALTGRWWIAVVGIALSGFGFRRQLDREATLLRADREGLSLKGGSVPWSDVDEVVVATRAVHVTLDLRAPPAPGTLGVVTRPGDPATRQVWSGAVSGDPDTHVAGIREVAPERISVQRAP